MKRSSAFAAILVAVCSTPAIAQHPTTKRDAKSDSTVTRLIGAWEGAVYSDHAPESQLRMTFTKGDTVSVAVSISVSGQEFVTGPVTAFKVDGNSFTMTIGMMDQSCTGSGLLIEGALKGDFNCGHGGVTYLAKKK